MGLVATRPGIGAGLMGNVGEPARNEPGWPAVTFLVRRVPFTTAVVVAMLMAAVASGALWTPIQTLSIYPRVAFGLPAFADGRWYTLAFGAFFALIPVYYLFVAGGFALLVGFSEYRLGTGRAVVATVGGHVVGVLGAAAVLAVGRNVGWPWGQRIGAMTDVGFSAGMLAAVCVASLAVAAPWGLRIRLAALAYAGLSLLYVGLMADLEHLIAVLAGIGAGRVVAGPRAVRRVPPSPAERRLLGAAALVVVVALQAVVRFFPGQGPTGTAEHDAVGPLAWHVLLALVGVAAAVGWLRGRRWGLRLGLVIVAADLLVAAVIVGFAAAGGAPDWLRMDAPTAAADAVTALAVGALLMMGRAAADGAGSEG